MRDKNDGRVTFTQLCKDYGLDLEQTKNLWAAIHPPFPIAPTRPKQ